MVTFVANRTKNSYALKSRKTFSSRLTNRYLLIVRNEEDFAEKTTYTFTYAKLILFIVLTSAILLVGSLFLVSTLLSNGLIRATPRPKPTASW